MIFQKILHIKKEMKIILIKIILLDMIQEEINFIYQKSETIENLIMLSFLIM